MNKIIIVGSVGSGKTTLARRLSTMLQTDWHELDAIAYDDSQIGRPKRTAAEQMTIIKSIDYADSWILEGVPRESYKAMFELADTIILLHPPKLKTYYRITTRFIKQKLGIEKAHYKPTWHMFYGMFIWANDFYRKLPQFEGELKSYNKKIVKLTSKEEEKLCQLFMSSS